MYGTRASWTRCSKCPSINHKQLNGLLLGGNTNHTQYSRNMKYSITLMNSKNKRKAVYVDKPLNKYYRWSGSPEGSGSTPRNYF